MAQDQYDDDDLDFDGDDQQDDGKPNFRRRLEQRAKRAADKAAAAEARAEAAERRLAFAEAGVKLDDPKAKWFVKGYDGDLTADAIKAAATEAGLVGAPEPKAAEQEQVPADEQASLERMSDTSNGGQPAGERDFHAEMLAAKTPEELHRIAREAGVKFAPGAYTPTADDL